MSQDEHRPDTTTTSANNADFPWALGVFDAHCHPTDTMSSIVDIAQMKARTLTVMATRGEDQELVFGVAKSLAAGGDTGGHGGLRILPCFGWHPWFSYQVYDDTAAGAGAGAGVDLITDEIKKAHYEKVLAPSPKDKPDGDHFISALPAPKLLSELLAETRERLLANPTGIPTGGGGRRRREGDGKGRRGVTALVGEIGLDRAFRLPNPWTQQEIEARDAGLTPGSREGRTLSPYRTHLEHQKTVLRAQLQLAGELQRPVSLHSVQAHGAVFDIFKELWKGYERRVPTRRERKRRYSATGAHEESDTEDTLQQSAEQDGEEGEKGEEKEEKEEEKVLLPFPPRICMHSYSGPVDPVRQFLHPSNPSDVYFSFSNVINFSGPSAQKVIEVVKILPDDRILIESDLHTAGPIMDQLLEDVVRQVCEIRGWELVEGVKRLGENWKRFVYG